MEGIDSSKLFSLMIGFIFVVACAVWAHQLWRGHLLRSIAGNNNVTDEKTATPYQRGLGKRGAITLLLCAAMVAGFLVGVMAEMFGLTSLAPVGMAAGWVFGVAMVVMMVYLIIWANINKKRSQQ